MAYGESSDGEGKDRNGQDQNGNGGNGKDVPPAPSADRLFPFPAPQAFKDVVGIAWRSAFREGDFIDCHFVSCRGLPFDFTFDDTPFWDGLPDEPVVLTGGQEAYPAPPEFFPFGDRGDGSYVGWVLPAPELGWSDHPVALGGLTTEVGYVAPDTRSGLEWLLSHMLRNRQRRAAQTRQAGREPISYPEWDRAEREVLDRLNAELGIRPDPDSVTADANGAIRMGPMEYPVPSGWRHVPTEDWTGVLAPADAFTDREPLRGALHEPLDDVLDDTARLLDEGYPATALVGLKDTQVRAGSFALLKPLWQRAYRMLGRDLLADRLDAMKSLHDD